MPDTIPDALRTAERVLVRRDAHNPPLAPLYDGPYTVVQRGPRFFKLQIGDRQDTIHVNRLKPFAAQQTPTATPLSAAGPGSASLSQRTNQHSRGSPVESLFKTPGL